MKPFPVYFLAQASEDLERIGAFILNNGGYPTDVIGYLNRLRLHCQKIGNTPFGYAERSEIGSGLRVAPFAKSAIVIYRVHQDAVEIVNVFYRGRDYYSYYAENEPDTE